MVALATAVAARKGLKLPRGLKSNGATCRAFLDQHVSSGSSQPEAPQDGEGEARPPSPAMLRFAEALAHDRGTECPEVVKSDFNACRKFLDEHAPERDKSRKAKSRRAAAGERSTGTSRTPINSVRGADRDGTPTGPMIGFARRLAQERGLKVPPGVLESFQQCRAFLDQHSKRRSEGAPT